MSFSPRVIWILIAVILVAQLAGSYSLSIAEVDRGLPTFSLLPSTIGQWTMASESALEPDIQAYLRPDDYVLRDYNMAGAAPVNVFAAYFRSLQSTYGPHSPKVCLPGSGWLIRTSDVISLRVKDAALTVNRYVMQKNRKSILVVYWYQNDRHTWAAEVWAKIFMLPDMLRYRRSDLSLIRVISEVPSDVPVDVNNHPLIHFTKELYPLIAERHMSIH